MMHEILFRGKIINRDLTLTKEWIYGYYCDEAKSPIKRKGEKDYISCQHISKYDQHWKLTESSMRSCTGRLRGLRRKYERNFIQRETL